MESGPRNHDRKGPHLGGRVEIYRWHMPKGYRSHCCLGLQAVHPKEPNEKTLDFLAFKLHKTGSTLEVPVLLIDWLREKPLLYFVQPFGDIDSLLQSIKFDGLEINYENAIWAHLTARPGNSHDKVRSVDRERWQGGHRPYLFYLKFGGQKPYARLIIVRSGGAKKNIRLNLEIRCCLPCSADQCFIVMCNRQKIRRVTLNS